MNGVNANKKYKAVCVGSSAKDIFFPTGEGIIIDTPKDITSQRKFAFELGAKYQIDNRFESLGGCAANVACGLSRLGIPVFCQTKTGDDLLGRWIKSQLEKEGVNLDMVETEKNCKSDLSAIIVNQSTGERVIFFNRDANEKLKINPEKLKETEWIFISGLNGDWGKNLNIIIEVCARENIKLAFNPGQKNIKDNPEKIINAIKSCVVLIVNKDEAIELVNYKLGAIKQEAEKLNDEIFLLKELKNMGAKVIALTDGIRGSWVCDGENIFYAEALGKNAIDSTGAGDAFSSGFLAGYIKEKNIKDCLRQGAANAAGTVGFFGAIEGLCRKDDVNERIKNVKIKRLGFL